MYNIISLKFSNKIFKVYIFFIYLLNMIGNIQKPSFNYKIPQIQLIIGLQIQLE